MLAHGYAQYRRAAVETASPGELLLRLYSGALNDLAQARLAIEDGDAPRRHRALTRAHEIVRLLQQDLDMQGEGASLARTLNDIYAFLRQRILDANINKDAAIIIEVEQILGNLQGAWHQAVLQQAVLEQASLRSDSSVAAYAAAR